MSLEDILKEVEGRADSESSSIQKEYEEKISKLNDEFLQKKKSLESEWEKKTKEDSNFLTAREEDLIRVETRRILDNRKNQMVMEFWDKGRSILEKIISGKEGPYIPGLMLSLCRKKLGDDMIIQCNDEYYRSVKTDMKYTRLPGNINGMICKSPDEKEELDLTIESILADIKDDILVKISSRIR